MTTEDYDGPYIWTTESFLAGLRMIAKEQGS